MSFFSLSSSRAIYSPFGANIHTYHCIKTVRRSLSFYPYASTSIRQKMQPSNVLHGRLSCRRMTTEACDVGFGLPNAYLTVSLDGKLPAVKGLGWELGSSTFSRLLRRHSHYQRSNLIAASRRKCRSDNIATKLRPIGAIREHESTFETADVSSYASEASYTVDAESEPKHRSPASDAPQHVERANLSCCSEPHAVPGGAKGTKKLEVLLTQTKHPAQVEWEQLWYNGILAAYQRVAHYFPEQQSASTYTVLGQSISEPILDISNLKQAERALFEQEQISGRNSFAPKSQAECIARQQRATKATNEQERKALLLGLPTFQEYTEHKLQIERSVDQEASQPSKRQLKREAKFAQKRQRKSAVQVQVQVQVTTSSDFQNKADTNSCSPLDPTICALPQHSFVVASTKSMTHESPNSVPKTSPPTGGAAHRPLVVGLKKPESARSSSTMASTSEAAALNKEIAENVKMNTTEAAPTEDNPTAPPAQKSKKEKAPKQSKPQKAAAPAAPTSPALIDLRVGHILRAIAHPNADSLYVSTIAMGDPEGAENTQVDEETGKVVRTVCSGLRAYIPLEEMQNRKIIVVANLKPVNMRSIKSAAMVLAASPKKAEGEEGHAPDRVVELVSPPENAEAGDKVYFEGWSYGEGKGPEKQLNPKKKQWEAIQPGFYTSNDLVVGFDASQCEEVDGSEKGNLVVEGKGMCKVPTLKGASVS